MFRLWILVLAFGTGFAFASANRASIHEQIESCPVTSDARCLRDILHALAAGGGGGSPGGVLVAGIYDKVSGTASFCPQQIVPFAEGGVLKLTVNYIEGCSLSEVMTCVAGLCQNDARSRTITVLGSTSYSFNETATGTGEFRRRP